MFKLWCTLTILFLYIVLSPVSSAEDMSLTNKEIIERLVRLEEGQISLNRRLDDINNSVNKRFDDMNNSVNKRFDDINNSVNKRFDDINKRFDDVNKRVDHLDKRIDDLRNEMREFMLWGFGVTFAGMFSLVGFVLWDRRSAIAPLIRSVKEEEAIVDELKRREKLMEDVLTEYSKDNPPLASLLKKKGIL